VHGPETARPPLVVQCHGGPTGAVEAGFDVVVQFFTTRGFAVAAVDYGGSTGYGRPYRDRLHGAWGVVDVEDCADAAADLADRSLVDGRRTAIRGSSAGGLTALGALARTDQFAAAVTWYGVTDLRALAASTHDFEARYCDWLVGPLPDAGDEYDRRSPRWAVDRIRGAVLLLQGTEDPIVPPEQAATMAAALRARGLRCELLTFEGEGHGFRQAATIEQCLRAEHRFYLDVLVDHGD
jgi:dipeptidyl aminopeptidase/acylaminoacyl peptidase